ncbi:MAG: glycosyltransferase family 4 protein [Candidatus Omnitrophota bacterium]
MGRAKHLFIVNDFPPIIGGQSSYLYYLCRALSPDEILVMAPCCKGARAFDQAQPFKIMRKPYLVPVPGVEKLVKILLPFVYLIRMMRREPFALLHCAHILSTGFVGLMMKAWRGQPYVVYTHAADILEYQHHPLLRPWLVRILGGAKFVVTNSHYTRAQLERLGVGTEKIIISAPRIDSAFFGGDGGLMDLADVRRRYGLGGRRVVLSINRLVPRKGNDVMIRALPLILEEFPEVVYAIWGEGPCRQRLKDLVGRLGLQGSVVFFDGRGGDFRRELMACCEVFVMVSRAIEARGDVEGFGVVYLEAGAAGKPVVGGDSGGVPDAVEDGVNGFLVDPQDPVAAADAVKRLLSDKDLARRMGAQGRLRVLERFDYRRGVPELDVIFKERQA